MKNLISFIALIIFLHTTTYYMIVAEAQDGLPDPVLDMDGDQLRAGISTYSIRPALFGIGGGLVANRTEGFCEFAVVQQPSAFETGEALIFLPAGFKMGDVVPQSTDMNIGFFRDYGCHPYSIWKVDDYDESAKKNFVMLGGVVGNPGNETVSNWFKIEKVGFDVYKIVFCPSVCDLCTVACSDVGIHIQDGLWRLALSDAPLYVRFQKVVLNHKKY